MNDRLRLDRKSALAAIAAALISLPTAAQGGTELLKLEPLVQGPQRPTGIHHAGDGSGRLFLLSKLGTISIFDGASLLPTPFLDIAAQVTSSGSERGLHGLAFHPDYASNGFFYVLYTNLMSDSILSRWKVSADPNVADPTSEQLVLFLDQPHEWHNVSQLQFGRDGFLYIGAGDGGFAGDPGDRAQDLSELLGKILRIDIDAGSPYAIPPSNPFVSVPGARPEIWAYGVRNPWRFSFDRLTGDLYMGDVGQGSWEEVNFQPGDSPGGENYGWRLMEGVHCYDPPSGCAVPGLTLPIFEHAHGFFGGECAVIGGFVYRGTRFPRFFGSYFYGDWCSGRVWMGSENGGVWTNPEVLDSNLAITTFGEDEDGELLVADDNDGTIYRLIDPLPFCDVELSQASYTAGETVTLSSARLINLGDVAVTVRLGVIGQPPVGPPVVVVDLGADGSFQIPAGFEMDFAPISLFTVPPGAPLGTYSLTCRLEDPATGSVIHQDKTMFQVN